MIDDLMNSEYNNAGELFGIEQMNNLMNSANPLQKAIALKKVIQSGGQVSRRSRAEMEKHFKQLPNEVKHGLLKGSLRLADYTIYSIKQVNSKTIKLFEPQDNKEVGVRNISDAKLPKNTVFLVSGIYLLTGTNTAPTNPEGLKTIDFKSVSTVPAICNGEFSFKANRKQLIPENQAVRRFATDNDHSLPLGYYKLDNPRLINDEEIIEFTLELGTNLGIPANQWVYVGLDGTGTTP